MALISQIIVTQAFSNYSVVQEDNQVIHLVVNQAQQPHVNAAPPPPQAQ